MKLWMTRLTSRKQKGGDDVEDWLDFLTRALNFVTAIALLRKEKRSRPRKKKKGTKRRGRR